MNIEQAAGCCVPACDRDRSPKAGRGMCGMHYQRVKRHGTTDLPRMTLAARYWSRVVRTGEGECWSWDGSTSRGYGQLSSPRGRGNAPVKAHRVSYEMHYGPIPTGMEVCHRCDNPPCSNPEHLFLGTHADNMRDMGAKGRVNPLSSMNLRPGEPGRHGAGLKSRRELGAL